jgi:hypothetical protein
MNPRSQNRLAILRRHMDAWSHMTRHNRSLVAEIIFEAFNECGLAEHIAGTGVEFTSSEDHYNDMRVRGQKLWRWIGAYEDCKPQPDKLFYIEQVIVGAMPEPIRVAYLAEVYAAANISIAIDHGGEGFSPARLASVLIKENSEAQAAVVELGADATPEQQERALKELRESAAATRAAIEALEQHLNE